MEKLRVLEACFAADTHTMEKLRVLEACFAADTQIVETVRYNKGTLYSQMPTSGVRQSTAPLRYEPCTQFINVSQRALHIYFIDGC